jgi:predicted acylesterase/phospholipase RssA
MAKTFPKIIRHLVLSGGGFTGFCFYGALRETNIHGFWNIKNINTIHATSVGSLIGVCISMGHDWETLDNYIINRPWNQLFKIDLQAIINSISNRGLFNEQLFYKISCLV